MNANFSEVSSTDLHVLSIYLYFRVLKVYVPNIRFLIIGCTNVRIQTVRTSQHVSSIIVAI